MKKKIKLVILLLLVLLCAAGCSRDKENMAATGEGTADSVTNTEISENPYRVRQLIPLTLNEKDMETSNKRIFSDSYGGKLYLLTCCYSDDYTLSSLTLYTFDVDSLETEKKSFSLELLEQENFSVCSISSMHVTGENELTLLLYGFFEGMDASPVLYRTDITGKPLNAENPLFYETEPFTNLVTVSNKLFTITDKFSILTEWETTTNTTQIYQYDTNTGKKISLITLPNEFIDSLCSNDKDTLYYIGNGELKRLDMKTLTCEVLCNIKDCGISPHSALQLLINDKEELAICSIEGDNPSIYLLTNEEDVSADSIPLVCLQTTGMEYVSRFAASWSVTSGIGHIKVEKTDEEQKQEALRNRTMAEIVSGKGPELMWVSEGDMRMLAEKGALMDISELITQDVTEQLLPGVLHAGTVDGTFVGITPEVFFRTLMTSDSVWDKDTWTVSDIMELVESRDDWEWPFVFSILKPNFYTLFYGFIAHNLAASPFVDIENGISYFNNDEFIKALNFCKKYGEENTTAAWIELEQMLMDGTCAAQQCYFYDGLGDFSLKMREFENCKIVGFPRNDGSGSYLCSEGYLVVNANAVHIDAIKDFIASLLDYDNQYTVNFTPVRKDVLRDSVVIMRDGTPAILKSTTTEVYRDLETKPDGTSYLEEFMSFVESCEPQPYYPQEINDILGEELPSYLNGDKTAQETADIIHRRVQLYFVEHK